MAVSGEIGTTLFVSTTASTPATETESGYDALTFAQVVGVTSIPALGDEIDVISAALLETGRTNYANGVKSGGTKQFPVQHLATDAGMAVIAANPGSTADFSFKVVDIDGTKRYFFGRIGGVMTVEKTPSSAKGSNFDVHINSAITTVAA